MNPWTEVGPKGMARMAPEQAGKESQEPGQSSEREKMTHKLHAHQTDPEKKSRYPDSADRLL